MSIIEVSLECDVKVYATFVCVYCSNSTAIKFFSYEKKFNHIILNILKCLQGISLPFTDCVKLSCPDAAVVHVSGSGQSKANPHVAGPWLSPGKLIRRAVTTMGSNDMVVGEDNMLGPSCQRYKWQTGSSGSIAFGSSPRRGKTLISNPRCLAEVSTC